MKQKTYTVISSLYANGAAYKEIARQDFASAADAVAAAKANINSKTSVVLRPNFNEKDERGRVYFREWRSFNGSQLEETIFPPVDISDPCPHSADEIFPLL